MNSWFYEFSSKMLKECAEERNLRIKKGTNNLYWEIIYYLLMIYLSPSWFGKLITDTIKEKGKVL